MADDGIPESVQNKLIEFHGNLSTIEDSLAEFFATQLDEIEQARRIKTHMDRLKELEDKAKAPKLDKKAAKNFLRNAMWQPSQQNSEKVKNASHDAQDRQPSKQERALDDILKQLKEASNQTVDVDEQTDVAISVKSKKIRRKNPRLEKNDIETEEKVVVQAEKTSKRKRQRVK